DGLSLTRGDVRSESKWGVGKDKVSYKHTDRGPLDWFSPETSHEVGLGADGLGYAFGHNDGIWDTKLGATMGKDGVKANAFFGNDGLGAGGSYDSAEGEFGANLKVAGATVEGSFSDDGFSAGIGGEKW